MGSTYSANPTTYAKAKTVRMRVFLTITIIYAQMLRERKAVLAGIPQQDSIRLVTAMLKCVFKHCSKSVQCDQRSLLAQSGLLELPVIMMLLNVTAKAGQKFGTFFDLTSDINYITHTTVVNYSRGQKF